MGPNNVNLTDTDAKPSKVPSRQLIQGMTIGINMKANPMTGQVAEQHTQPRPTTVKPAQVDERPEAALPLLYTSHELIIQGG